MTTLLTRLRCTLLAGAALAFGLAAPAGAAVINGSDFTPGLATQVIGGLTWTAGPSDRTFQTQVAGGVTMVGVSGGNTWAEIDVGETLTATAATPFSIQSITLGLLFNGPEYNDVLEAAQFSVNVGSLVFTLTTTLNDTVAVLSNAALGTVTNLSPASSSGSAMWRIDFTTPLSPVTSLQLTAIPGVCGSGGCTNQSDFAFVQMVTGTVSNVPEPAAAALLLVGLAGLAAARRRRGQNTAATDRKI